MGFRDYILYKNYDSLKRNLNQIITKNAKGVECHIIKIYRDLLINLWSDRIENNIKYIIKDFYLLV